MKIKMYDESKRQYTINFNRGNIENLVLTLWNRNYTLNKIAIDMNYSTDFIESEIIEVWVCDGKEYDETKQFDDFGAFVVYPNRAKSVEGLINSIYNTIKGMSLVLVNT